MRKNLEDLEVSFWLQGVSYLIKVLSSFSLQRPWGDVRPESPPLAIPLTPALPRAPEAAAPAHAGFSVPWGPSVPTLGSVLHLWLGADLSRPPLHPRAGERVGPPAQGAGRAALNRFSQQLRLLSGVSRVETSSSQPLWSPPPSALLCLHPSPHSTSSHSPRPLLGDQRSLSVPAGGDAPQGTLPCLHLCSVT